VRPLTLTIAALALAVGCGGSDDDSAANGPKTPPAKDTNGSPASGGARAAASGTRLVRVGTFRAPTYLTAPPGDRRRLFVVEQPGTIRVMRDRKKLAAPFLDIRADVLAGGERGLLSMAFAPGYAKSGLFYVYFTGRDGDIHIQEFKRASADRADAGCRRELLRVEHSTYSNHNGGQLQFGPDGLLYAGLGDGGGGGDPFRNAQNLGRLLGKIIRIDPGRRSSGRAYAIPASNPFAKRGGARPEVYAYGFRNPWRVSFDRTTGDMTIADVGQDEVEEVDFTKRGRAAGKNFGWSSVEGRRRYNGGPLPDYVPPVIERFHSQGWCSITGGYIVRDRSVAALYGRYVYGDFCASTLRSAKLRSGHAVGDRATSLQVPALSSFGEDARGRVYALSLNGPVYQLAKR
jgi:glucose/arabinose dehydrogenase